MFTTIIAATTMALAPLSDLKCPVMGGPAILHTNTVEYAGATFGFCCPGCETRFAENPVRHIQAQARRGSVVGLHLFDPVSGRRIAHDKAEFSKDHQGIRYLFASKQNLDTFTKNPNNFTRAPRRESLECPVMRKSVEHISQAGGYVDHQGVRYYVCCPGCLKPLAENPAKYLEKPVKTRAAAAVAGKPILDESALLLCLAPVLPVNKGDANKCDCTRCNCECGCDVHSCKCKNCDCDCGCADKSACKCENCACAAGACKCESCKCDNCACAAGACKCQDCKACQCENCGCPNCKGAAGSPCTCKDCQTDGKGGKCC